MCPPHYCQYFQWLPHGVTCCPQLILTACWLLAAVQPHYPAAAASAPRAFLQHASHRPAGKKAAPCRAHVNKIHFKDPNAAVVTAMAKPLATNSCINGSLTKSDGKLIQVHRPACWGEEPHLICHSSVNRHPIRRQIRTGALGGCAASWWRKPKDKRASRHYGAYRNEHAFHLLLIKGQIFILVQVSTRTSGQLMSSSLRFACTLKAQHHARSRQLDCDMHQSLGKHDTHIFGVTSQMKLHLDVVRWTNSLHAGFSCTKGGDKQIVVDVKECRCRG